MNLLSEIQREKAKRDTYLRLGKRHQALICEANMRGLMLRQFRQERLQGEVERDIAIASGDLDAAQEVLPMSKLAHGSQFESLMLEGARRKADHVRTDAGGLVGYVRQILDLPEYDTAAEEAVADAKLALTEALLAVTFADNEFKRRRIALFGIQE